MLASALEHYRRQQRITAAGLIAAQKAQPQGSLAVARVVTAFQILAARDAVASVGQMLEEQAVTAPPVGTVAVTALAGVASDGRPLDTLFDQAKNAMQFGMMVATQLQDAARGAAGVSIASRPRVGYVRMLNPPSCSRCAVLAGKWFKWNAGFDRHPRCDCRHIPSLEVDKYDHLFSPDKYFHSLSPAEQDRIFTKAGAQAVRDGADVTQVVNARRGMQTAQIFGRTTKITTEGTSSRGLAFDALSKRGGSVRQAEELAIRHTRTGPELRRVHRERARAPRVMPESIYQIANGDRELAQRLLKINGYIT